MPIPPTLLNNTLLCCAQALGMLQQLDAARAAAANRRAALGLAPFAPHELGMGLPQQGQWQGQELQLVQHLQQAPYPQIQQGQGQDASQQYFQIQQLGQLQGLQEGQGQRQQPASGQQQVMGCQPWAPARLEDVG